MHVFPVFMIYDTLRLVSCLACASLICYIMNLTTCQFFLNFPIIEIGITIYTSHSVSVIKYNILKIYLKLPITLKSYSHFLSASKVESFLLSMLEHSASFYLEQPPVIS